jgi:microcystin-dependent protein
MARPVSAPFLSELRLFSFPFPPKGWAFCDGQMLPINQNQALFALLGTTYGGDGVRTFALPNLQGRVPTHSQGGSNLGHVWGAETETLTLTQLPNHTHLLRGTTTPASTGNPTGNLLAAGAGAEYTSALGSSVNLAAATVAAAGERQPHENRQPFLVLNVCIALVGIFPSHG